MQHIESLRKHIEEGTLIRKGWVGTDAQGRTTACLLAAMVPQCGEYKSPSPCPAEVMPGWLAELTPWIDDSGSGEAWPAMVERFASLAARWHALDAAAWRRVQYTFLAGVVREAASHTQEQAVLTVCDRVAILCDGVVSTSVIDAVEFDDAAWAAAWAAAEAAARAARAARDAAWAAAVDRMTVILFDAIEKELA